MDDKGNLYANQAALDAMDEQMREHFQPTEDMPADAIKIADAEVASQLAAMNHRARRVYFSERRRGASEQNALDTAHGKLPR